DDAPVATWAVLEALGDLEGIAGRYEAATDRYQQAMSITQDAALHQGHEAPDMFGLNLKLADALLRRALYADARRVLVALDAPATDRRQAQRHLMEGRLALAEGNITGATTAFQTCLNLLAAAPASSLRAQAYAGLGSVQVQIAQYDLAAHYYEQAIHA